MDLSWLQPDTGGATITSYTYQWKSGGQSYTTGRQGSTSNRTATVTGLTNSISYDFRVRATNSVGSGPYSNEDSATPVSPLMPPPAETFPGPPTSLTGVPRQPLIVDWTWGVPLDDGGASIEDYDFQWRYQGDNWASANLTNGLISSSMSITLADATRGVQARALANNSVGAGTWVTSAVIPAGDILPPPPPPPADTVPGLPTAHTGTPRFPFIIDWVWEVPDDNGGQRIESYDHQWRYSGDGWSVNTVTTESTYRRITIANANRSVQARARARNSVGTGGWGGTVTVNSSDLLGDAVPDAPASITGTPRRPLIVDYIWTIPPDDGGQPVLDYDFQWRYDNVGFSGNLTTGLTSTTRSITLANDNNGVQARVRARNSVGTGAWRTSSVIAASSILPSPQQRHRFTSSQTWNWPYDDLERATMELTGASGSGVTRDATKDINVSTGILGATSDGTTLWFIQIIQNDTNARAYTASTRVRDTTRDINLGTGSWNSAVSDGTTLWFVDNFSHEAIAHTASTQARDASRDIDLGVGSWFGSASDGTTLWFVDANGNIARAYTASTRVRDTSKDITLTGFNIEDGGTGSDGTTIWFVDNTNQMAIAHTASTQARDASRDIDLGVGSWFSATSDGTTLWFVDSVTDFARAYMVTVPTEVVTGGSTYTTSGTPIGFLSQQLTNIADNQSFVMDIPSGMVDVLPQS